MIEECDVLLILALHAYGMTNDEISFETPYTTHEISAFLKKNRRITNKEKVTTGPNNRAGRGRYEY